MGRLRPVRGEDRVGPNPDVAAVNWFSPGYLLDNGRHPALEGRDLSTADGAGSAALCTPGIARARRKQAGAYRQQQGERELGHDQAHPAHETGPSSPWRRFRLP